jgi:hypothetical protein
MKTKNKIMDKIILVHYIDIGEMPMSEVNNHLRRLQEQLSKQEGVISYVIPTRTATYIECINPKLVSEDEFKKAQEVLDRNQRIVDNLVADHSKIKEESDIRMADHQRLMDEEKVRHSEK